MYPYDSVMTLPGRSRTIVVEPLKTPRTVPAPAPPAPPPKREPAQR
jgi:hypothetical protein